MQAEDSFLTPKRSHTRDNIGVTEIVCKSAVIVGGFVFGTGAIKARFQEISGRPLPKERFMMYATIFETSYEQFLKNQ